MNILRTIDSRLENCEISEERYRDMIACCSDNSLNTLINNYPEYSVSDIELAYKYYGN